MLNEFITLNTTANAGLLGKRGDEPSRFFYFSHGGETESSWYCGHCLTYLSYQLQMIDDDCGAIGGM
jgi:hypothetical protein